MAAKSSQKPRGARPVGREPSSGSQVSVILLGGVGVVVLAALAVFVSYNGIYQVARQGRISADLAHLYPGIFTLLLVMAFWTTYLLRTAPPALRLWVDAIVVALIALAAAATTLHLLDRQLLPGVAVVLVAVAPWAALLVAFRLWLWVVGHLRDGRRRRRPARAGEGRPATEDRGDRDYQVTRPIAVRDTVPTPALSRGEPADAARAGADRGNGAEHPTALQHGDEAGDAPNGAWFRTEAQAPDWRERPRTAGRDDTSGDVRVLDPREAPAPAERTEGPRRPAEVPTGGSPNGADPDGRAADDTAAAEDRSALQAAPDLPPTPPEAEAEETADPPERALDGGGQTEPDGPAHPDDPVDTWVKVPDTEEAPETERPEESDDRAAHAAAPAADTDVQVDLPKRLPAGDNPIKRAAMAAGEQGSERLDGDSDTVIEADADTADDGFALDVPADDPSSDEAYPADLAFPAQDGAAPGGDAPDGAEPETEPTQDIDREQPTDPHAAPRPSTLRKRPMVLKPRRGGTPQVPSGPPSLRVRSGPLPPEE